MKLTLQAEGVEKLYGTSGSGELVYSYIFADNTIPGSSLTINTTSKSYLEWMNEGITSFNGSKETTAADYCPYTWVWTNGNWPHFHPEINLFN